MKGTLMDHTLLANAVPVHSFTLQLQILGRMRCKPHMRELIHGQKMANCLNSSDQVTAFGDRAARYSQSACTRRPLRYFDRHASEIGQANHRYNDGPSLKPERRWRVGE